MSHMETIKAIGIGFGKIVASSIAFLCMYKVFASFVKDTSVSGVLTSMFAVSLTVIIILVIGSEWFFPDKD